MQFLARQKAARSNCPSDKRVGHRNRGVPIHWIAILFPIASKNRTRWFIHQRWLIMLLIVSWVLP